MALEEREQSGGNDHEKDNKDRGMERTMTNNEAMSNLTVPLCEVAQHHLQPDETVLTAIYGHGGWLRLTGD
jgi:hypothetical protein